MKTEVSIITPSYNSKNYISRTIESVLKQSFKYWELIIVDDCSSDGTASLIREYCVLDSRIKLFETEINLGAAKVRNIGINKAIGRYIAFLDSDDFWDSTKLEKQISFMKKNNFTFTFTQYFEFDDVTDRVYIKVVSPPRVTYNMLLRNGGYMGCLTVIYDTQKFGKMYMPNLRKRQDWALWLIMLKNIDCAYGLQEPLAYYRKGNQSISKKKYKLVKYNFLVYRRVLKMSFIESSYRILVFLISHFFFKSDLKTKV